MRLIIGIVVVLIFLSGCVDLPFGISNPFGGDSVSISNNVEKIGATDIIIIKDVSLLPKPPLLPNQEMTLSILLETKSDEEVDDVSIDLYDAPNFRDIHGKLCNLDDGVCIPEMKFCSKEQRCQLSPGEEKDVLFRMLTPDKEKKTTSTLSYSVKYNYFTSSSLTIPIINENEIIKKQRSNQNLALNKKLSIGSGPIQIEISSKEDFILSGQTAVLIFEIKNKGQGIDLEIESNSVEIVLPDMGVIDDKSPVIAGKLFECVETVCKNIKPITIYRGKSAPMYFLIKNIKSVDVFETQLVRANVTYGYELRGSYTVDVKPYGS